MADGVVGCARPTGAVVGEEPGDVQGSPSDEKRHEAEVSTTMVGRKAPDFAAPAYHRGSFKQVKLSDHLGKWVVLCFYPGDFTFV